MSKILVEICTDNLADSLLAISLGADRVELCSDLANDGLTPSVELFENLSSGGCLIFPMIRCRAGDFVYTELEKLCMLQQAKEFIQRGAPGIVIGALTSDGFVDIEFVKRVWSITHPCSVSLTFHKAIDVFGDKFRENCSLLRPYVDRILTSGGVVGNASEEGIRWLVSQGKPIALASGKIRPGNVNELIARTGVMEVHSRDPHVCTQVHARERSECEEK